METIIHEQNPTMILRKYANARWVRKINDFIESKTFIALLAFLALCSNVLGLEFLVYTLVILYGYYLCLFGRDMRSVAAAVPFMYVSPSIQNNPSANPNSLFYPEHGLWLLIAYLVGFFVLLTVRIVLNYKEGTNRFFAKKRRLLSGFLLLGLSFFLGGVGQAEYTFLNVRYSFVLFISMFLFYYCLVALVDWKSVPRDYFAWIGFFFGILISLEVVNICLLPGVIVNGQISKNGIYTGWGINNNIGAMLVCAIPCAFYLAATKRHAPVYVLTACGFMVSIVLTMSRNSILFGGFLFAVSAVIALWNKKNRKQNLITYGVLFVVLAVGLIVCKEFIARLLESMINKGMDDSGRFDIYIKGFQQYISAPVFGKGFYACDVFLWGSVKEMTFVPPRWHNTLVQILASCGSVGLLAYGLHRWQTVKLFWERPNLTKTFIGLCVGAIVLTSILDCHLFNIGPDLLYSVGFAFAEMEREMPWGKPLLLGDAGYRNPLTKSL